MQKTLETNSDPTQLHPYEYLTQLNSIYSSCNKANTRSYPSVSKMKLAWKPFSIIKIPNCFQITYQNWQRNDKQHKLQMGPTMEDNEKKIWKDHEEIMKRYLKGKQNSTLKLRPRTCMNRKVSGTENGCVSTCAPTNTLKTSQQSNLLIKKMIQKGMKLDYNKDQVKEEVLKKLKQIQSQMTKKKVWRTQSAKAHAKKNSEVKLKTEGIKTKGQLSFISNNDKSLEQRKEQLIKLKNVKENEYLEYNRNSEMIAEYRKKIREVDCAISDYNVKKTAHILRNMENIVKRLQ